MGSGLYQSRALKFVIGRFRQGRDRHRQAVLKARSAAVSGAVLGAALASTPVYAVVRASRRVGQTLRRSLAAGFSGIRIDARNLLNFSDFADTFADSSSLAESSLDIKSNSETESPILKTLLAVGACLSPKQVWQLHRRGVSQRLQGWLSRWGVAQQFENRPVKAQITGVASDLTPRSLVLVRDHTTIWSGLSAAQQSQLQTKITLLLAEEQPVSQSISFTAQPAEAAGAIDGVKALTYSHFLLRPLRFFWVEVLRMISQWRRSSGANISMPSQSALDEDCQRQKKTVSPAQSKRANRALPQIRVTLKDCVEASAVAIGYVEHPLEIVLKWVDRCLLWLEDRWRSLKQWLTHKPI
ncbi:MAG: hypothetical protein DCF15_08805 [Phormidesmis priestleyi]|uniref:Uncharacterized protein n=1 Tax=Phormidesmis priestleyi TaxID=268141 RepID=A0A2W4XGB8_9CYAN|nr:MAG: hypothetical protein DCF15_08805 [Phormidesmis priestleyi]